MSFCSSVRIIVPYRTHRTPQKFASHDFCESPRRLRETIHSAWFCVFRVKNSKQGREALCSFVLLSKFSSHRNSCCSNSAKVRAVCVKQKSPLVVPKTSRPLRLCVRIKISSYVLLSKEICEFREFCVKIIICSSCQKQSSAENQEFFVPQQPHPKK